MINTSHIGNHPNGHPQKWRDLRDCKLQQHSNSMLAVLTTLDHSAQKNPPDQVIRGIFTVLL
jgi:hypothetical protein